MDFSLNSNANIVLSHAGNFLFNWTEMFASTHRVVHFVRNPYHMVISGLLYHSQSPPPEGWLLSASVNPCEFENSDVLRFTETISTYHSRLSRDALLALVEQTVSLCHDIYKNAILKYKVVTYHKVIFNLFLDDQFRAVQLEACRAILSKFSGSGGDILRMAANAVRENQASYLDPMISKRLFLSDFPIGDRGKCYETFSSLFRFLLTPSPNGVDFWREKITVSQAIDISLSVSYLDDALNTKNTTASKTKRDKKSKSKSTSHRGVHRQLIQKQQGVVSRFRLSDGKIKPIMIPQDQSSRAPSISHVREHITHGKISKEQRKELISNLQSNPILSPLLNLVQLILTNPQPYQSTSRDVERLLASFSHSFILVE